MVHEVNVKLADNYAPAPDISFWTAENRPPLTPGLAGKPDLAIEIWSPHDLDGKKHRDEARQKIERYREANIPIAWIINPERREVEVSYADPAKPGRVLGITDILQEDIIPGFQIAVKDLFPAN